MDILTVSNRHNELGELIILIKIKLIKQPRQE